jgi:lysophospholipase L1-like esterase
MLRLFVLFIFVAELMYAMPDIQSTAEDGKGNHLYLALGDSLAVGEGATNRHRLGYVGLLDSFLQLSLKNLAVSGETSSTFISDGQLKAALKTIANPGRDVQLVTLDIGGDDLFNLIMPGGPCVDPTTSACAQAFKNALTIFANNYTAILEDLTSALGDDFPDKNILVMTYYNPFSGTGSVYEAPVDQALLGTDVTIDCTANQTDPTKMGLNDLITCIGDSFGVTVVNIYPLFEGNALALTHIAEGDIHPNNDGYALIANAFIASANFQ